jgi:NAD(P)-dependent dehydrogenase (short-subunit alcohol dehydrogenase family)
MSNRLNDKVALVTRGNSGRETVHRFLEEGATIYWLGAVLPAIQSGCKSGVPLAGVAERKRA